MRRIGADRNFYNPVYKGLADMRSKTFLSAYIRSDPRKSVHVFTLTQTRRGESSSFETPPKKGSTFTGLFFAAAPSYDMLRSVLVRSIESET